MKKFYPFLAMLATPIILILMSNSSGSPGGKSGSPGDAGNTCTQCHGGTASTMTGWITTNVPASGYVPGQTYSITATATHSGASLIGFELTVETANGTKIGTLQLTEPTRTKFTNNNKAVTHTSSGTTPSGNSNTWTMNWVAPATAQGTIGIYAAFNAADGNGNTSGDVIYKSSTFISPFTPPPALVSILPNQAEQGDSFQATITGSNTQFSGSPSVSLSYSGNPLEVINATSVNVVSATVLQALFTIPSTASTGLWDVNVNSLLLDNGFTILEAVPAIIFMDPNFAFQGESINGAIFGENTAWSGTPNVYLSFSGNPADIINGTNVTVVNGTQITADFIIPANATTGNYDVHVDDLIRPDGFTVLLAQTPALTGISPGSGDQGAFVSTTITAINTQFSGSGLQVSLVQHDDPSEIIEASGVLVVNSTTLQADFDIPYEATPGWYVLHVNELTLDSAFRVIDVVPYLISMIPDSALQGEMVTTLITAGDSRFTLGAPSVSLSYSGDPLEMIPASSVAVISDETVEAVFNIPANASTGSWDLHVDEMMLAGAFEVLLVSGIGGSDLDMARIYPNPARQRFIVENVIGADLLLLNAKGDVVARAVITGQKQEIDINGLATGMYFVKITTGRSTRVEKLLVY